MNFHNEHHSRLVCLDIDDTLFFANQPIIEVDENGAYIGQITNTEYNDRQARGETASNLRWHLLEDSKSFRDTIRPNWTMLNEYAKEYGKPGTDIIILTGRTTVNDVELFKQVFRDHGVVIDSHDLIFAGNHGPGGVAHKNKRVEFERICNLHYKEIVIYDDHVLNLIEFQEVASQHPQIKVTMWLVDTAGYPQRWQ